MKEALQRAMSLICGNSCGGSMAPGLDQTGSGSVTFKYMSLSQYSYAWNDSIARLKGRKIQNNALSMVSVDGTRVLSK